MIRLTTESFMSAKLIIIYLYICTTSLILHAFVLKLQAIKCIIMHTYDIMYLLYLVIIIKSASFT